MYHEILDDPKIGMMTESDQLIWFKLLCLASQDKNRGNITLSDEEIAFKLRTSNESWQHAKDKFRAKGLIEHSEDGAIAICNWADRQRPENPYGRPSLTEWKALRDTVFARDNHTCRYCGAHGVSLQCDHVTPISRGGSNDLDNLATACKSCNQSKHNKTPDEWLGAKS